MNKEAIELIARAIRSSFEYAEELPGSYADEANMGICIALGELGDALESAVPGFDRDSFQKACGLTDAIANQGY